MRSDGDIKRDVEEELRWDPKLDAADVAVAVKDGVVTLTGYVRNYSDTWLAENAAKRVAGVVGVANDIEVRLPKVDRRPDPDIARDAVAVITYQLPVTAERIRVVVKDGRVTLEGEVEWHHEREGAESIVRWVKGVKRVINLIRIKAKVAPTDIKRKIEEAFWRSADVNANRITIETNDGEVVLGGTVRSWAERELAERTAWAAPGVTKVENRIVVSP